MSDTKYDGQFDSPYQRGKLLETVDPINRARKWRQRMGWKTPIWTPMPLDSAGPRGGFLIRETEPEHAGAGILHWERHFAEIPDKHQTVSTIVYNYQFITDDLIEIPVATTQTIEHEYFHTDVPGTIPLIRASRYTKAGNTIFYFGTLPIVGAKRLVAADSEVTRWLDAGNIYVRKTPYVPNKVIESLLLG